MDRRELLSGSVQVIAGLGLACPCVAGARVDQASSVVAPAKDAGCAPTAGAYPHATSHAERVEFAKTWTGRFLRVLDERLDEKTRCGLLEANGRVCAAGAYGPIDPGKAIPLDAFVARLAEYVGKENARREGDVVYFTYVKNPAGLRTADGYCLCPLVEDGPADLSPTFCQCSVGYVGYMFEKNLGRPVRVELLESVRRGGKACRFAVRV